MNTAHCLVTKSTWVIWIYLGSHIQWELVTWRDIVHHIITHYNHGEEKLISPCTWNGRRPRDGPSSSAKYRNLRLSWALKLTHILMCCVYRDAFLFTRVQTSDSLELLQTSSQRSSFFPDLSRLRPKILFLFVYVVLVRAVTFHRAPLFSSSQGTQRWDELGTANYYKMHQKVAWFPVVLRLAVAQTEPAGHQHCYSPQLSKEAFWESPTQQGHWHRLLQHNTTTVTCYHQLRLGVGVHGGRKNHIKKRKKRNVRENNAAADRKKQTGRSPTVSQSEVTWTKVSETWVMAWAVCDVLRTPCPGHEQVEPLKPKCTDGLITKLPALIKSDLQL